MSQTIAVGSMEHSILRWFGGFEDMNEIPINYEVLVLRSFKLNTIDVLNENNLIYYPNYEKGHITEQGLNALFFLDYMFHYDLIKGPSTELIKKYLKIFSDTLILWFELGRIEYKNYEAVSVAPCLNKLNEFKIILENAKQIIINYNLNKSLIPKINERLEKYESYSSGNENHYHCVKDYIKTCLEFGIDLEFKEVEKLVDVYDENHKKDIKEFLIFNKLK